MTSLLAFIPNSFLLGLFAWLVVTNPIGSQEKPAGKVPSWPQFRGPNGSGIAVEGDSFPVEFGPKKKVLWKTSLPVGNSSPCIWGERIFLTGFDKESKKLETFCLDRSSGKILWRRRVPAEKIERTHKISSPATPTPATDGERVYVYFGSYGLLCYDFAGELQWEHPLPIPRARFGAGASPVLVNDLVILSCEHMPRPYLLAVNRHTGKTVWKKEPFLYGDGCCTPVVWLHDGKQEIVLHTAEQIVSFSPKDGRKLWWIPIESTACTSPVVGENQVFVASWIHRGEADERLPIPSFLDLLKLADKNRDKKVTRDEFPRDLSYLRRPEAEGIPGSDFKLIFWFGKLDKNKDGFLDQGEWKEMERIGATKFEHGLLAIKPGGEGDIAKTHISWKQTRYIPEVSSPLFHQGLVYLVRSGGIVTCLDAQTGRRHYTKRLGSAGMYFASPSVGNGKIYVSSYNGVVSIFPVGKEFRLLAQHDFGERIMASPALVDGYIYLRTENYLYAMGQ